MKIRGLIFALISLIMLSSFSIGANETVSGSSSGAPFKNTNEAVDKAYQCLEKQIESKPGLSLQEAIFGMFALGDFRNLSIVVGGEKSSSQECWPKSGCKIKETAQVALAYQRAGKDTSGIKSWLLSKQATTKDLSWFLEIDTENKAAGECSIKYQGKDNKIKIGNDMALSGSPGSCLEFSSSRYLLKIKDSCLDENFEITCNQSFVSTLLYQKNKGSSNDCLNQNNVTCYIASATHAATSLGTTSEKVSASCFNSGAGCEYEGSLWAALALSKMGSNNVSITLPYLIALAEDYGRFFPSSFISILAGDDEQYSRVIEQRKQGQYWDVENSPYNRFYDTSLGMLALSSSSNSRGEIDSTQDYLLSIQTKEGCWNNNRILDTSFILYSGWPRGGVAGPGSGGKSAICEEAGLSCERLGECTNAGGRALTNFECASVGICCSVKINKPSCSSEGGKECRSGEQCSGRSFESSSGACCVGSCIPSQERFTCEEEIGAICKDACEEGEVSGSGSCQGSKECCIAKKEGKGFGWIWIVLLILIILLVLAIIFRHRLQLWWFRIRGGGGSTKSPGGPGSPPQQGMIQRVIPRQTIIPNRQPFRSNSRPFPRAENDDVFKKLRDMTK